ncbi:MAG TPA: hypothetical protein VHW44_18910 [Pseudonocardiaceae bacterium]|nr:hypothetical protein [Pseudonocardiaceae bacterium]
MIAPLERTEPVPVVRRPGRTGLLSALAVPILAALVTSAWIGINFDIRYAVGGLRVAGAGGVGSFATIFVHRPLAYRAFVAALQFLPAHVWPGSPAGPAAEFLFRFEALLLVAAAAVLLWLGLRRYRSGRLPAAVAIAVGIGFALAPNWSFLEPDWAGALFAVAAIGVALLPRRTLVAALLGGVLLLFAVTTKTVTAAFLPLALGVIALADRRRAVLVTGWTVGLVLAWAVLTWRFEPTEWQWLHDMASLVPGSPLRVGLADLDWRDFAKSAADMVIVSPVVLGLPAATVLLVGRATAGRRLRVLLVVLAAVLLTALPVFAQGEWFLYQWVALPVLTAALIAVVLVDRTRTGLPAALGVLGPVLLGGLAGALLLTAPLSWRAGRLVPVFAGYALLAVLGAAVAGGTLRRGAPGRLAGPRWLLAGVLSVVATLGIGVANLPAAAYSFAGYEATVTNLNLYQQTTIRRQAFGPIRARIGPNTPVLYFAFGDISDLLGNPTHCRYPSPVWLQRSTYLPYVRNFASYRDNVSCLDDPTARYLVLEPSWFQVAGLAPALSAKVAATFDCAHAISADAGSVLFCPRRP